MCEYGKTWIPFLGYHRNVVVRILGAETLPSPVIAMLPTYFSCVQRMLTKLLVHLFQSTLILHSSFPISTSASLKKVQLNFGVSIPSYTSISRFIFKDVCDRSTCTITPEIFYSVFLLNSVQCVSWYILGPFFHFYIIFEHSPLFLSFVNIKRIKLNDILLRVNVFLISRFFFEFHSFHFQNRF